jgi:hypothetical protein
VSNQFPPSGYGASSNDGGEENGRQVFGSQNEYNQYGSNDYGSYSGDQYASQGDNYASQGDAGQYGQQQNYGQQPQYGQQGYGQQDYAQQPQQYGGQPQAAPAYGNYGDGAPGQQNPTPPKKKGPAPWVFVLVGVAAVALVGGGIWGGIALFGGGGNDDRNTADDGNGGENGNGGEENGGGENGGGDTVDYPLSNTDPVTSVSVTYNGSWESQDVQGQELFYNDDSTCTYLTSYVPSVAAGTDFDPDDVASSLNVYLNTDTTGYELDNAGTTTATDTNGVTIELGTVSFTEDTYNSAGLLTVHAFEDDLLMYQITCSDRMPDASELDELIAETDTTLTE